MGGGMTTPFSVLADKINARVNEHRQRTQKAKDENTDFQRDLIMKGIQASAAAGTLTDDQLKSSLEQLNKLVPKESIPLMEAWHRVMGIVNRKRRHGQEGPGSAGGGQGAAMSGGQGPTMPPTAVPKAPGAAGGGGEASPGPANSPGGTAGLYPSPEQRGTAEGKEAAAKAGEVNKSDLAMRKKIGEDLKAQLRQSNRLTPELETIIDLQTQGYQVPTQLTNPKLQKAPKVEWGPGGEFRGIEEPEDPENRKPGQNYYTRESIPKDRADLLKLWDDAKAQSQQEKSDEMDKEKRRQSDMMDRMARAMANAMKVSDHKAARKVYDESFKGYNDSQALMEQMDENYKDIVTSLRQGKPNQQAMVSMLSAHLAMTLGKTKGVRITRAMWEEAADSAPWLQRVEAKWSGSGLDSYLTGVVLSQEQAEQMLSLGHQQVDIRQRALDRVKDEYGDEIGLSTVPRNMRGKNGKTGGGKGDTDADREAEEYMKKHAND